MSDNSIAYVLSGGGAKGCFQVGAMQALKQAGIKPKAIYGTSVGALNSFGFKYMGLEKLIDVWFKIRSKKDILKFNWDTFLFKSKGIYNLKPLINMMLDNSKDLPHNRIESIVTRVSLTTGELEYCSSRYFKRKEFIQCVASSSAIPGIMDPIDNEWVDGGVREMAPISKAIQDGYKTIIAIETNPTEVPLYKMGNFAENAYRAIDGILEHEVYLGDLKYCEMKHPKTSVMRVYPDHLVIDTLEFNKDKIKAGFAQGFAAANKLLEKGHM